MEITAKNSGGKCVITLRGRVDSGNAKEFEDKLQACLMGDSPVLDLKELEYISSAGLRVILGLRKRYPALELINASTEVYDVLEMTGFTEMMRVSRALREISLEGAVVIGDGANGTVYRMNDDTVVKVYKNPDSLGDIKHEREVARQALVLGIPTAISYDLVKVGDRYATVFEMLDAKSFSKLLADDPEHMDEYVEKYISLLKQIHATKVPEGKLPSEKKVFEGYVQDLEGALPEEAYQKLLRLAREMPENDHMIHADYHTKNLMLQNNEVLLIDMDTLACGLPLLELGFMYNAFWGYYLFKLDECKDFLGIPLETAHVFWKKSLRAYFPQLSEEELNRVEEKAKVIGLTRIYRKTLRKDNFRSRKDSYQKALLEALSRVDKLE